MNHDQTDSRIGDVTRRTFVKTTAAAVTVGPALAASALTRPADPLHVGLIGCGGRGTGAATQALAADPDVVITAMGDVFEDRLTASLKKLQGIDASRVQVPPDRRFVGFDAYRGVLGTDVDVVILAAPPHFRPAHLDASIDGGKHVFCEKPMAVDAAGVRRIMGAGQRASAQDLSLVSGFCWRYSLPERATYERIHDGAIGDVVCVHTTYHTSPLRTYPRQPGWSDMEWQLRNWWHFAWLSGDHIVEQACHSIDKINWAKNGVTPVRATALGGRQMREGPETGNVYDHFTVIYEYADGTRSFHTCRQMPGCSNDNSDYILGTEGSCVVNGWAPTHVIEGRNPWSYDGERRNMYQVEHDELFASIRAGEPINDGEWMANSTMMSILGRTAAYTGRTVEWDDALGSDEKLGPASYAMADLAVAPVPHPEVPGQADG